jgi:ring-1,2-phenylacetyl-CoA epoxidase subunit PaaD
VNADHSPGAGGCNSRTAAGGEIADRLVQRAWEVLEAIPDPEIPVVSIRELGILREINARGDGRLEVVITPTYSGCPAMGQIEDDVRAALTAHGIAANVVSRLAPPWTTDWMGEAAKEKLRAYGIAPPQHAAHGQAVRFATRRASVDTPVPCPRCGSADTTETSHFGSTSCKSLHKCLSCLEPFDYFKPY